MENGEIVVSWQNLVKYPSLIPVMPGKIRDILDTMEELVPITWDRDRLGTFLTWRRTALDLGLITRAEYQSLADEMIHGCGGM
jgi:hypothetical protein